MDPAPTREDIEQLAYRLWLERGCPSGTPEQDWDRAETMLRSSRQDAHRDEPLSNSSFETARSVTELPQPRPIDTRSASTIPADSHGTGVTRKASGGKRKSRGFDSTPANTRPD